MSDIFLEVVAKNAKLMEGNYRPRSVEIVADHVIDAIKVGRELPLAEAAQLENLHILAAVAAELDESIGGVSEPCGVDLDKVTEAVEAIYSAVAAKMVEARKVEYTNANGWRIELDCDQVFPSDPGNGAPALVHTPKGSTATLYCALNMGEVEYEEVSDAMNKWLEHFMALSYVIETRTHPETQH